MTRHDGLSVAVVGLGAMGSAVALGLARRGVRVTGFDAHEPPHRLGSSHGESRIIRSAYFEDPAYVPLVSAAYQAWARLERDSGRELLIETGGLTIGPGDGELVRGAARSAEEHALSHEILDARAIRSRYPQMRPERGDAAVYEPQAGVLRPEACISAALQLAASRGAELRMREPVTRWEATSDGVKLETPRGSHRADLLVLAAGPWLATMLPALPLVVERQVAAWFTPRAQAASFLPPRLPVYLWETAEGTFYGFPDLGGGVKAARHHGGRRYRSVEEVDGQARAGDVEPIRAFLERRLPGAAGALRSAEVCRYTNAPESRFIIDHDPANPGVFVVSACSGHGFKFASAIGEAVATRLTGGRPEVGLELFRWPAPP